MSEKKAEREGCTGAEQVLLKWSGQGAWLHSQCCYYDSINILFVMCVQGRI